MTVFSSMPTTKNTSPKYVNSKMTVYSPFFETNHKKMEKPQCYICLEECLTPYKPCQCRFPIHKHCFITWVTTSTKTQCRICNTDYTLPLTHKIYLRYTSVTSRFNREFVRRLARWMWRDKWGLAAAVLVTIINYIAAGVLLLYFLGKSPTHTEAVLITIIQVIYSLLVEIQLVNVII
jgi:hypothetical protein